ncbi:MAG: hypothetical protein CMC13_14165 [Flavobacteriaceae bacterium]|nr:hypothetical protein [Flavobacteriaceae bacterium]|tara:strand:+ start:186946 stop:190047 length:3102 start_codon:yes stop_codon:yes gene_type:complete
MINKIRNTPATKFSLLLLLAVFGFYSCNQNSQKTEEITSVKADPAEDAKGDTFSIVAYDKTTGQVGGAGCSCVPGISGGIVFLSDLITDGTSNLNNIVGAIHSQASYNSSTQAFARNRMLAGDTPQQIIDATVAADGGSASRQYGVVGVDNPGAAGWTGSSNGNYANDIQYDDANFTISIQGNILDSSTSGGRDDILNDMQEAFLNAEGTLADRLLAAMQGAKRVGGDSRCYDSNPSNTRGSSGTTAFVQVLSPGETTPSLSYNTGNAVSTLVEPIDVLQCLYDNGENTPFCRTTVDTFPYSMDFETKSWEQETATCSVNSSWIRSRHTSPSGNTGPAGANQGDLYLHVEASNIGGQGTSPRDAFIGSPCFTIPSNSTASITFDYHMFGSDMGTLSLKASSNGGSSWTTLWSETGNQGNSWFNDELVDISSYAGSTVKFRFEARLGNGFESDMALDDIQIDVQPILACSGATKTWNGSSWSPSGAPGLTNPVVIAGNYDTSSGADGSFEACTVTVNNGATLTVGADSYMLVDTDITVNGTLQVDHTGNVVQNDDTASVVKAPIATIQVDITTPVLQTRDFMVMGSPMSAETRNGVFADAFLVLNHNTTDFVPDNTVPNPHGVTFADLNGDFWKSYTGAINVGEGYIVRPQDSYSDPANEAYFMTYNQGTLNNGEVVRNINLNTANDDTPNIYANPYPSAMSGFELINQNPLINEIYFWEHLTPPSSSIPGWNSTNFSMRDISMYNLTGGTKAPNDTSPTGVTEPNGVISTGQGFAIMATNAGTMTMNNSMRLSSGNTTLRAPNQEDLDKLWLSVKSVEYEVSSSMLLGFNPVATANLDPGYDSERLSDQLSIFTTHIATGSQLGIQTTSAFDSNMKFPVGFLTKIEDKTTYEIALDKVIGERISNAKVFLHDSVEGLVIDLTTQSYVFESNATNSPERFTVFFTADNTLGAQELIIQNIKFYPNPAKDVLNILSANQPLEQIEIYDMRGRLLEQYSAENNVSFSINVSALRTGVYFVKINTASGSITKRFIKE